MVLLVTTVIGLGLLTFGIIQVNFDLSFIGFDIAGDITASQVPEINEPSQRLLGAKAFVGTGNVISSLKEFAVGQRFTLESSSVISDFTVRLATEDPDATVTGFIWNADGITTPPIRLAQSAETFNGTEIGTILRDVTFTFPQAVVLTPTVNATCLRSPCLGLPISYVVGFRVDQNLAGSFTYAFNVTEQIPIPPDEPLIPPLQLISDCNSNPEFAVCQAGSVADAGFIIQPVTHEAVFDGLLGLVGTSRENHFFEVLPRGTLGIDIFHNRDFAIALMEDVEEVIEMSANATATVEEELTACIAIFPPPAECTGDDPLAPLECGLAEELVGGACVCKEGFSSQMRPSGEGSECVFEVVQPTSTNVPPPLQVPARVDPLVFIGLGAIILIISLIGFGVRRFRK